MIKQRGQEQPINHITAGHCHIIRCFGWCLLAWVGVTMYAIPMQAQCTLDTDMPIPDGDTLTVGILVDGLINANLSSPTQGICGVEVAFNHEMLGDINMTLVSPNGTQVVLIGPAPIVILPTSLSSWNIEFIPCADTPMPDAGFAPVWSNNQGWQSLAFYNGSYHPSMGCLENFNTGPANGIWQLVIVDHAMLDLGNLLDFRLIFCDSTGLECEPCRPNAGTLSPASIIRCENESISTAELSINYGIGGPPTSEYIYEYLLVQNNMILHHGPFFNVTAGPGNYTICGLSYHQQDSLVVSLILESGTYPPVDNDICADLTNTCVAVQIDAIPDTVRMDTTLCSGEVIIIGDTEYNSPGTYYQFRNGPSACDTVIEIRIASRILTVTIPTPDTLTCGSGDVNVVANVAGATGPFSYLWTTDFGNITSPPTLASITANQAGPYIVSVTDGICSGTAFTNVLADQAFPQVFVEGSTLSCNVTSVLLEPIYIPTNGNIQWTGPGGFNSNQANVSVSVPGTYFLEVTNQQGCSTTRPVEVGIDTATVIPVIVSMGTNCQSPFHVLGYSSSLPVTSQVWTAPDGMMVSTSNIFAVDPGIYSVSVTFANGCVRNNSFFFNGDFLIPDLSVPLTDTLNCNESITLSASSNTPGVSWGWSGPQNFVDYNPTIVVDQAGVYTVTVYAPNGCGAQQSITIVEGNDLFEFEIFTDTITCLQDSVPVQVISAEADQFNWLNYSGPEQGLSIIHVSSPGLYTVEMTDNTTGCIMTGSIFVPADLQLPVFGYLTDTITCNNPIASLEIVTYPSYPVSHMYWELPDFSIVHGPTLMSGQPGEHRLVGVAPNGCVGVWHIQIPRDTIPPFLLVQSDTISCQDTVRILAQSLDSVVAYTWTGPGIIDDQGNAIDVNLPGIYTLEATGVNGCISTFTVQVDSNYILPTVDLTHDSLRCDQPATLTASSPDPNVQFVWYDSGGQILALDSFVQVNLPGQYIVQSQGANKCAAYDTITLLPVTYPVIGLTTDTLTCAIQQVTIQSTVDVVVQEQYWINATGDTIDTNPTLDVSDSGPYTFAVTGMNGCITRDTIAIPVDTIAPDAELTLIGEIRCQDRDIMFSGLMSTPTAISYLWSTTGGNILSDPALPQINAQDTGIYFLTVMNLINGCENTDSFHLLPNPDDIVGAVIAVQRPVCSGQLNGSIQIESVTGGIGPFLYQLPPAPPQVNTFFDGIGDGQHLLIITDDAGCEYDTLVEITSIPDYSVDAGTDIEIYIGDMATLSGSSDLADSEIANMYWDSLGTQLCGSCDLLEVSPWETTTYTFTVEAVTGCIRTDEVTVYVLEQAKYFIPNVFTPNGDGINDEIRLFARPGIMRVLQWIIFDRWGDAVYGATDFDPSDPTVYWDGLTTTGEKANPAVFPYLLEVQLINGSHSIYHGDITLIR